MIDFDLEDSEKMLIKGGVIMTILGMTTGGAMGMGNVFLSAFLGGVTGMFLSLEILLAILMEAEG